MRDTDDDLDAAWDAVHDAMPDRRGYDAAMRVAS